MANTEIRLKYSTTTGNTPSSLANGELAINSFDGKLFYSDPSGNIKQFSSQTDPSGLNKEIQFNDSGEMGASPNLTFDKVTGVLSSESVKSNSYFDISDVVRQESINVSLSTISTISILSFPISSYGSGKFLVQATSGSARQVSELLITHNGVTSYATEYAIIRTDNSLFSLDVDILDDNVRLLVTGTSSNTTTYKVLSTLLSA